MRASRHGEVGAGILRALSACCATRHEKLSPKLLRAQSLCRFLARPSPYIFRTVSELAAGLRALGAARNVFETPSNLSVTALSPRRPVTTAQLRRSRSRS